MAVVFTPGQTIFQRWKKKYDVYPGFFSAVSGGRVYNKKKVHLFEIRLGKSVFNPRWKKWFSGTFQSNPETLFRLFPIRVFMEMETSRRCDRDGFVFEQNRCGKTQLLCYVPRRENEIPFCHFGPDASDGNGHLAQLGIMFSRHLSDPYKSVHETNVSHSWFV